MAQDLQIQMMETYMIETSYTIDPAVTGQKHSHKMLRMVENDRMAGRVPVWGEPEGAKEEIAASLDHALHVQDVQHSQPIDNALSYAPSDTNIDHSNEEFGFADLLDMVNPLQQIPVVGSIYRHITGDEIKPISRIIGGAVYGGALGAASGLVSVIAEQETGDDITGNIIGFATGHRISQNKDTLSEPAVVAMADLRQTELYSRHPYQYND